MNNPTQQISYEILDPTNENDRTIIFDREEAQAAYNRGFLVAEHEIVIAYLSNGQKLSTILTTEWRDE